MTAIVSSHPSAQHQGVDRVSSGLRFVGEHIHNSRLICAGVLAAIVVLANALIGPAGLGAWLTLWAIAFAVAALLAPAAKRQRSGLLERWLEKQSNARANEQLWQLALHDHRVMADLVRARSTGAQGL